jgi:hypothetical protein
MAALFHEGCKQQPGHSAEMKRNFGKQFVWTAAMVKVADSEDGEQADASSYAEMGRI